MRLQSLCTNTGGEFRSLVGGVNASPSREGKLRRSLTEKRDLLCLFAEDLHVGGDTEKPYVTAALFVLWAIVLSGAPFPPLFHAVLLTISARHPPIPCDANHACTTPGRPVWLNPLIRQTSQLVIQNYSVLQMQSSRRPHLAFSPITLKPDTIAAPRPHPCSPSPSTSSQRVESLKIRSMQKMRSSNRSTGIRRQTRSPHESI